MLHGNYVPNSLSKKEIRFCVLAAKQIRNLERSCLRGLQMLTGLNSKTCSAIPILILWLLSACCIRSVTCLGSDQPQDSNSTKVRVNRASSDAIVGNGPRDENGDNSTASGEGPGSTQKTSSDEPNFAAETGRPPFWESSGFWLCNKMIGFYVIIGIAVIATMGWFFLVKREVVRTRLKVKVTMQNDPELTKLDNGKKINEFLIVFNWTQKVLYLPTIIASLFAAVLICVVVPGASGWFDSKMDSEMIEVIGGIWFAIILLNFLVEEYNIRLMVIIMSLVSVGFLLLWLYLFGWVKPFFLLFTHIDVFISWKGYLLVGLIGLLTILISWIRGLFYYVVITPNYINVQEGLTETGKQIARRDFYTSVDTTDLAERLLGFGKIKITFKGSEREPITLYVWKIGAKAKKLEEMGTKTIVT